MRTAELNRSLPELRRFLEELTKEDTSFRFQSLDLGIGTCYLLTADSLGPRQNQEQLLKNSAKHFEPRWPATVALLSVGGLRLALPEYLSLGPSWILLAVVVALMMPTIWARYCDLDSLNKVLGYLLTSIVTVDMVWSLSRLIAAIPLRKELPQDMLRSAAALWITNVLVFASWYWRLDAGGPRAREQRGVHTDGAFLFPQMTLNPQAKREMGEELWSPGFVDYLFLAFNTSTAFSPTDSPVLSPWAKVLMMVQALISFVTVALLAARAINIL